MVKNIVYSIDGAQFPYTISGEVEYGPEIVMLHRDNNLIADMPWANTGYTITDFIDKADMDSLTTKIKTLLIEKIRSATGTKLDDPAQYHHYVNDDQHLEIARSTYDRISYQTMGFDVSIIERCISRIVGKKISTHKPHDNYERGDMLLRIVRPGTNDNNPFHRDVWLDRLRNCVNLYVPLWGSDKNSSLPLIPCSHLWKESDIERTKSGAKVNGIPFTVPAVTATTFGLEATRPNPGHGEVMIFSPYLIHGGGINTNVDTTRISLEMRFWQSDIEE